MTICVQPETVSSLRLVSRAASSSSYLVRVGLRPTLGDGGGNFGNGGFVGEFGLDGGKEFFEFGFAFGEFGGFGDFVDDAADVDLDFASRKEGGGGVGGFFGVEGVGGDGGVGEGFDDEAGGFDGG